MVSLDDEWMKLRVQMLDQAGWESGLLQQIEENLGLSEADLRDQAARIGSGL